MQHLDMEPSILETSARQLERIKKNIQEVNNIDILTKETEKL
jgi:Asp-tRNA(Asn)/Glu-tRNA(Gln) amidotransferase C subunit